MAALSTTIQTGDDTSYSNRFGLRYPIRLGGPLGLIGASTRIKYIESLLGARCHVIRMSITN